MATRQLVVSLKALVAGYSGPMAAAAKATTPLEASLLRVQRAGMGMARIGASMTRRLTLPLLAVGGVALKMSSDFEQSLAKVAAITAVSRDEVDSMRGAILRLAVETGKAPKELGEAFFFAASATRDAQSAMALLERAAKASAAGLGDTKTIVIATASALNAYGDSTLSAATAADILVATASAGNFEVDQLAGALGRVLPFAREAGVSFADVGGAVALLTAGTGDANLAVTQLSQLFQTFAAPTKQTRDALAQLGLTTEDVKEMMGEQGLATTVRTLVDLTERYGVELRDVIPNSRGMAAALELSNADAKALAETFGEVNNATQAVDNAFTEMADTVGFKARQAWAQLQVNLIEVGDTLAKIAVPVLGFISDLTKGMGELPGPVKTATLAFLGLLALSGPLMQMGGNLAAMFARVGLSASNLGLSMGTMNVILLGIVAAIGVASLAVAQHGRKQKETEQRVQALTDALRQQSEGIEGAVAETAAVQVETRKWGKELADAKVDVAAMTAEVERNSDAADVLRERLLRSGVADFGDELAAAAAEGDPLAQELLKLDSTQAGYNETVLNTLKHLQDYSGDLKTARADMVQADMAAAALGEGQRLVQEHFEATGEAIDETTALLNNYFDTLRASVDPIFAAIDATQGLEEAHRNQKTAVEEVDAAQRDLDEIIARHGPNSDQAAEATGRLEQANRQLEDADRAVIDASFSLEFALGELDAKVRSGEVSIEDATAALAQMQREGKITSEQAMVWAARFASAADDADKLARDREFSIRAKDEFSNVVSHFWSIVNALPRSLTIPIRAKLSGVGGATSTSGGLSVRQHGGPVFPGRDFLVGEAGPEIMRLRGVSGHVFSNPQSQAMMSHAATAGVAVASAPSKITLEVAPMHGGRKDWFYNLLHEGVNRGYIQLKADGQRVRVG